jgi:beta-glucuronidase
MRTRLLLLLLLFGFGFTKTQAQYHIKDPGAISLNGDWWFVLDPAELGIKYEWYKEGTIKTSRQDKVTVPHCFSTDPRYEFYTGTAWYRKFFPL